MLFLSIVCVGVGHADRVVPHQHLSGRRGVDIGRCIFQDFGPAMGMDADDLRSHCPSPSRPEIPMPQRCTGMVVRIRIIILAYTQFGGRRMRSEEHTSELQSLMRISYAVFCLKKKKKILTKTH